MDFEEYKRLRLEADPELDRRYVLLRVARSLTVTEITDMVYDWAESHSKIPDLSVVLASFADVLSE